MKSSTIRLAVFLFAMAIGCVASSQAADGDNWADRLGYPPGSKVVVLHGYGMGLCYESNAAIGELLDEGQISSASVMPPCPWFADAAERIAAQPGADVGLQLTINSEPKSYRWKPIGGDALTRSLVDADGHLWRSVTQVMINARPDEVERELRAQIEYARRHGVRPTHLTTHLGALFARQDLTEMYLRLSREYWIPAVVIELTPDLAHRFREQGFAVPDQLAQSLDDYPFPKVQDLMLIPPTESFDAKVEAVVKQINSLRPGLSQIAIRPAVDSPALRAITTEAEQRVWEAAVWRDERVVAALRAEGVVVSNWIEIMRRFEGKPLE